MLTADLLRHGELEGGIKYRGQTDDPLTAAGRKAMDRVWTAIRDEVDLVVSSPLLRCAGPARDWAKAAGIPFETEMRMAELHYGEWEGMTKEDIEAKYPGMLARWRSNPAGMQPPGGESMAALQKRVAGFWEDVTAHHDGKHLLIVAHSGSLRMLIAHVLGAPLASTRRVQMPYGCWSRISHRDGVSRLEFHNCQV